MSHGSSIDRLAHTGCRRRGNSHSGRDLTGALLLTLLISPAASWAQQRAGQPPHPRREAQAPGQREGEANRRPGEARPRQRLGFFQRLREMPPWQQQRVMENSPQFQRLPRERQEMIRQRLRMWNQMTPQQQERVREREEIFQSLSPAQRQEARSLFPQYRELTPARRQAVIVAFRHLRDLPPDQRQAYLNSQYVREQYSPHEREILGGLNKLLPSSRSPAPDDQEP